MARKLGVVVLVLLLLLLVIPLGIGMVMAPCPECEAAAPMTLVGVCFAILITSALLLLPMLSRRHRFVLSPATALLLSRDLDPPPRSA